LFKSNSIDLIIWATDSGEAKKGNREESIFMPLAKWQIGQRKSPDFPADKSENICTKSNSISGLQCLQVIV